MSFDAGTIKGSLDLDTTSFHKGFSEAHTHAQHEGGRIREVLESITAVFTSALGPAVAEFAEKLQSVFAGFSEGPIIGSLNAIGTAFAGLREVTIDVAHDIRQMGLEAEKAGVSFEFMERLTSVGGRFGLGVDQISNGFKILEQQIEGYVDGTNKKAVEGFTALGISVQQAGELSKDPERLLTTLQERVGQLGEASRRTAVLKDVLGRAGYAWIPMLKLTQEEFNKEADTLGRLQGSVSSDTLQMTDDFSKLETEVGAAIEGIKREAAKPILKVLSDHFHDSSEKIEEDTEKIKNKERDLAFGFEVLNHSYVGDAIRGWIDAFNELGRELSVVLDKLGLIEKMAGMGDEVSGVGKVSGALVDSKSSGASAVVSKVDQAIQDKADRAREELKNDGAFVPGANAGHSESTSGPDAHATPAHAAAAALATSVQKRALTPYNIQRVELGDSAKGEDGLYRVKSASGGGLGGALTQDQYDNLRNAEKNKLPFDDKTSSPQTAAHAALAKLGAAMQAQHATPSKYNVERTELGDSVPDAQGMYHLNSRTGGGLGGTVTKDQYDNLRNAERSNRPSTSQMQHAGESGSNNTISDDTLSAWRGIHAQMPDSVAQRSPAGGDAGSGSANRTGSQAGNAPQTFNVTVNATIDPNDIAGKLMPKVVEGVKKVLAKMDQEVAGGKAVDNVSRSMGGN